MAIAFDNKTGPNTTNSTSQTLSYTVGTGDDRILVVSVWHTTSNAITGVTYNGIALTKLAEQADGGGNYIDVWYLVAPSTGSNNAVTSRSPSGVFVTGRISYSGVDQTTPFPTVAQSNAASSTAFSAPITTTLANSWIYLALRDNGGVNLAESGWLERIVNETFGTGQHIGDTNGTVAVGSNTLTGTFSSSTSHGWIIAELAEASAAPTFNPAFTRRRLLMR